MSTPIEQMILDAKRLANRLKEKEQLADVLSNETERVNYQLDSMRQFQDDINALNILARDRSNADMIHTIHQENPQIREIQQENRQLKASIEEHQRAIELIMTKYRQHTQRQIEETKLDFDKLVKASEMNDVSMDWVDRGGYDGDQLGFDRRSSPWSIFQDLLPEFLQILLKF